jgi:hypothetical protein
MIEINGIFSLIAVFSIFAYTVYALGNLSREIEAMRQDYREHLYEFTQRLTMIERQMQSNNENKKEN